jgi:hypothetical protein
MELGYEGKSIAMRRDVKLLLALLIASFSLAARLNAAPGPRLGTSRNLLF